MARSLLTIAVAAALVAVVAANSSGLGIYQCSITDDVFGCYPENWEGGVRSACNMSGRIMDWVSSPVHTDLFTLTVTNYGDDEAEAVTEYVPNGLYTIHIRLNDYITGSFRGLFLYAEDSEGQKVGEWELLGTGASPRFRMGEMCENVVYHANAEIKMAHTTIGWRAPDAGYESITMRAMLKHGPANTGAFYFPNADGPVVLSEGDVPEPQMSGVEWVRGDLGQSCDEVCDGQESTCMEEVFEDSSYNVREVAALAGYVCADPIVIACDGQGFTTSDVSNDVCSYQDATVCEERGVETLPTVLCSQSSDSIGNGNRICPCACDPESETCSDGTKTAAATLTAVVAVCLAGALSGGDRRALFFVVAVLAIFTMAPVRGHNWVNSNSRAVQASTLTPAPPARSIMPHVQVSAGQKWQVEWVVGHGSYEYFILLKDTPEASGHLSGLTDAMIDDYLASAPEDASAKALDPEWRRYHRKRDASLTNDGMSPGGDMANWFERNVPSGDQYYLPRPDSFQGFVRDIGQGVGSTVSDTGAAVPPGDVFLMEFKDTTLAGDARAEYHNEDYPFILSASRFQHNTKQPFRPDVAQFVMPSYTSPTYTPSDYGRYLLSYRWQGYYDVVDIDYVASPVAEIYGVPNTEISWTRVDHSLFEKPRQVYGGCQGVFPTIRRCMLSCEAQANCAGVNVVPLEMPAGVPSIYANSPNATLWAWGANANCDPNDFVVDAEGQTITIPREEQYLCYAVRSRADASDVVPPLTTTLDPELPIFYATAYVKDAASQTFDLSNSVMPPASASSWRFGDTCADCQVLADADQTDFYYIPRWEVKGDTCTNCDLNAASPSPPMSDDVAWSLVAKNSTCDGWNGSWRAARNTCPESNFVCRKRLYVPGFSGAVYRTQCAGLAAADPECSNHVMFRPSAGAVNANYRTGSCYCMKTDECCQMCSVEFAQLNPQNSLRDPELAQLVAPAADPTCATGLISPDGNTCCTASCGSCQSAVGQNDEIGFCTGGETWVRPCSEAGPPCRLDL